MHYKVIACWVVAFNFCASAHGRLIFTDCPNEVPVMTGFEAEKYLGRWYQYSAYWNIFGEGATCTNAIYSDGTDENGNFRIRVNNMGLRNGKKDSAKGYAVASDPNDVTEAANFIVNFDDHPDTFKTTNYEVLSTDYDSYAIVYDCRHAEYPVKVPGANAEYLYVLTRDKFPDASLTSQVYNDLKKAGFDTEPLEVTVQENCPEFPPE